MEFWKMNGAGNDFLILDNLDESIPQAQLSALAKLLCKRRLSIGADGMMVVEPSEKADLKMVFYNSDGSIGEMCGNGARCICRYAYENRLSGDTQTIETTAGLVTGQRIDQRQYRIRLNDPEIIKPVSLFVDGVSYDCTYVELGNPGIPHLVVPFSGLRDFPEERLFSLGKALRSHPQLSKGANVNFYELTERNHFFERTWERGVEGFTYACGTGTGSVAAVLTLSGLTDGNHIMADMLGGTLYVDVVRTGEEITDIYLTGPTNVVAKGTVTDDELSCLLVQRSK